MDLESGGEPILRSYSGDTIETIGKVVLNANHNGSSQNITVNVVKSNGPNLVGRDSPNPSYSPTSHKSTRLPTIQQRPPF